MNSLADIIGARPTITIHCEGAKHPGRAVNVIQFLQHDEADAGWVDFIGPRRNLGGRHQRTGKRTFSCPECGDHLQIGTGQWARFAALLDILAKQGNEYSLSFLRLAYEKSSNKTH